MKYSPLEPGADGVRQAVELGDFGAGCQRLQPAHLDEHPVTDQAEFAGNVAQAGDLVGIAAIDGG